MSTASEKATPQTDGGEQPTPLLGSRTLLEAGFPYRDVSAVALADRSSNDRIYSAHKWWARRPPAVIRALLLAGSLPAGTTPAAFWAAYADHAPHLAGHHVGDPFMGGATSVVEAARLGAAVTGIDVDPLSVRIARQELRGVDADGLAAAGTRLLEHLDAEVSHLFGHGDEGPVPLHFFFVREVDCPRCAARSLLYRNPVLARDVLRPGAVVRDAETSAFCPSCRKVQELEPGRPLFCCGREWNLVTGTFIAGRFTCPTCDHTATHQDLRIGRTPRVLVGVEETDGQHRRIRTARADEDGSATADAWWREHDALELPATPLGAGETARARNYGFERVRDLFSPRQLATFAAAFAHVDDADVDDATRDGLRLAVSNALSANNLLCGYATEYGRLAPLFAGVRAYSLPVLAVELNPLHRTAGRGTLAAMIRRVARTDVTTVRRHTFDPETRAVAKHDFIARRAVAAKLACRSADRGLPDDLGKVTLAVSDPPYFDYISYSDLSLFFRAWHGGGAGAERLGGSPIYPVGPDAATTFRDRLAHAFSKVREQLAPGAMFCFTFHATAESAWTALEEGVRKARFSVLSAFPVWADARAASHNHDGNCEWDLVFVCRPDDDAHDPVLPADINGWLGELGDFDIGDADRKNLRLGLTIAQRCAQPADKTP